MAQNTQTLRSDWPAYKTSSMRLGYAISVSLALRDVPREFAAMRFVSWTQLHRKEDYPSHGGEDRYTEGYEITLMAGEFLIRDCRAAHGGTPNLTGEPRRLPGVQVRAPPPPCKWQRRADSCTAAHPV